jgi:hypothetical protein
VSGAWGGYILPRKATFLSKLSVNIFVVYKELTSDIVVVIKIENVMYYFALPVDKDEL